MPFPREVLVTGGAVADVWVLWLHQGQPALPPFVGQGLIFRVIGLCKQEITKETNKNRYQGDSIYLQTEGDFSIDGISGAAEVVPVEFHRQHFPRDVLKLLEGSKFSQMFNHNYLCKGSICSSNTAFLGEEHSKCRETVKVQGENEGEREQKKCSSN